MVGALLDGCLQILLLLVIVFLAMWEMPVLFAPVQQSFPHARGIGNGAYLGISYIMRPFTALLLLALGDIYRMRTAFVVAEFVPLEALAPIYRFRNLRVPNHRKFKV